MGSAFAAGAGADALETILRRQLAMRAQAAQEIQNQAALQHYAAIEEQARRQTDLQQQRLDLEKAPKPAPVKALGVHVVGGALVDDSGKELYRTPAAPAPAPKVGVHVIGRQLVNDEGKVLFTGAKDTPPAAATTPLADRQDDFNTERTTRMRDMVNALKPKVSNWTVGVGSVLGALPATEATDFSSAVDALKANVAFKELQEMRQASKTGGALGQVSDRENAMLSSALASLNVRQSPAAFRASLQKISDSLDRWEAAKANASGGASRPLTVVGSGGTPTAHPNDPLGLFGR